MRMRKLWPVAAVLPLVALWWAFAQPAPPSLSSLCPPGAQLYLEAKDFSALLADWSGSREQSQWLASANYQVFSRSHLFLRLQQAQTEFASAAGVSPDFAMLNSVTGANSAFAMYNIGKLQFLYVTRLASARATETALWKAKGTYEVRHAGNSDYYRKEDTGSQRVVAFAVSGDYLLLATRDDLIGSALELIAHPSNPSLASEPWFQTATAAEPVGSSELRLVYSIERLAATHQFRSYWIQSNVADLREFSSGVADLERANGEIRERRALLRAQPASSADETPSGQALALIPDTAGFYRAALHPDADRALASIEDGLFPPAATRGPVSTMAPEVSETGEAGKEEDLETRIDQPRLTDNRSSVALEPLRQLLARAKLDAMLELGTGHSSAVQEFVRPRSAVVLLASSPWDANAVHSALSAAASGLWTNGGLGAGWQTAGNGVETLDGLGKIAIAIDGRYLIVSDWAGFAADVLRRRTTPAVAGASYAAGWRHARELPDFQRMMRLIDFPQIQATPAAGGGAREPMRFSENLASLVLVLRRVDSASIAIHDMGGAVNELVQYRLTP